MFEIMEKGFTHADLGIGLGLEYSSGGIELELGLARKSVWLAMIAAFFA